MEREEGEMSDGEDNLMMVDDEPMQQRGNESDDYALLYKAGKAGLVVEKLGKIDATKLEERAARFGLNLAGSKLITQKQLDDLYANCGIESGNERHFRLDTLHLGGVEGLSTREIFEYLDDYKPVSLEWVDAKSCNVVCQDHISAALALLVHSREIRNDAIKDMLAAASKFHWREGMPHEKKDYIFMRFATNSDKKEPIRRKEEQSRRKSYDESMDPISKNPWGDLCQSWGLYDHQEVISYRVDDRSREQIRLKSRSIALRLGKRTAKYENDSDSSSSSLEWKRGLKMPRMRMHADDEESRQRKKKEALFTKTVERTEGVKIKTEEDDYAPLSIEVANTGSSYTPKVMTKLSDKFRRNTQSRDSKKQDGVHSRLGAKITINNDDLSSDESEKSDHNVMSRVERVGEKQKPSDVKLLISINNSSSTEKSHKSNRDRNDLRQRIKSSTASLSRKSKDLRSRLGNKEALRIEIDNDYRDSD